MTNGWTWDNAGGWYDNITGSTSNATTYIPASPSEDPTTIPDEGPLAWLDERVDEICEAGAL